MIDIQKDDGQSSKIQFTHSLLPTYVDPQNVSTKKKPFSTFNAQHFSHTLDLILPSEIYIMIAHHFSSTTSHPPTNPFYTQYARVYMPLSDILSGDFFTEYIKKGNIMMRSEGRKNVDNVIELHEGILRLELDRSTYERCGLQGTPIEDGGRKHQKVRWVVEFDLRSPSMLHGKKGFGRLEWAAKNVLTQSLTWLFYNFNPSSVESLREDGEPISVHQPFIQTIQPTVTHLRGILAPKLSVGNLPGIYGEEDSLSLLEWIHLIALDAPRIHEKDEIDPFLSKYEVLDFGQDLETKDMVRVRWKGFLPILFIRDLFLAVKKEGLKVDGGDHDGKGGTQKDEERRWFALAAKGFGDEEAYTVMQWSGRETLCWETPK